MVQDFNFQSLRQKIKPAYLMYSPECLGNIHIKIAPEHKQETLNFIQKKFEEMAPFFIKEFKYKFFSDALNRNYEQERQQSRMLLAFTILAVVIAMMGVFGLVTLSTRQRTKEIGIPKSEWSTFRWDRKNVLSGISEMGGHCFRAGLSVGLSFYVSLAG